MPKTEGSPSSLPNRRLNPLYNPLLASNMGRWAQVYYTTSPEGRDRAVEELVRQLELEQEQARQIQADAMPLDPIEIPQPKAPAVEAKASLHVVKPVGALLQKPTLEIRQEGPVPVAPSEEPPLPNFTDSIDIRAALGTSYVDEESTGHAGRRIVLAAVLIGALLSGIWYLQTRSGKLSSSTTNQKDAAQASRPAEPPQAATPVPQSTAPQETPRPQDEAPAAAVPVKPDIAKNPIPPPPAKSRAPVSSAPAQIAEKTPPKESSAPATTPQGTAGEGERVLAQRYLEGRGVTRDSSQAARYLWSAVKKQNAAALVQLAGLYAKGDGVPKDCDQAKILVDAARRKGTNVSPAVQTLHESGCE